jgi:transcription elongation factor GreA
MNNKPAYVSREGLEKLRHELEELVNVRRAEVAAHIH